MTKPGGGVVSESGEVAGQFEGQDKNIFDQAAG